MADVNSRIQQVLNELIADELELGVQVAAYLDGELVVDTWAGCADEASGRQVDGDTLFTVFSTTKGITATCIHMLAERGKLDYDAPIARYWPEFGTHGKEKATVRDGLTHRVGIPQMPDGTTPELISDWDAICSAIAELEPVWEPGTRTGYHGLTYGWIMGEVLRRVDGRPIGAFVQEEICKPLGLDGLFLGIPDEAEARVAPLKDGPPPENPPQLPDNPLRGRMISSSLIPMSRTFNRPDVRRAAIPGAGGIMNARSLARHYAALANGGPLDGVTLLSPERIAIATTLQTDDLDAMLDMRVRKALGYWLGGPLSPMGTRISAFGHAGAGGSIGFADPEKRFAFGYTKNLMLMAVPPPRGRSELQAREGAMQVGPAYIVAEAVREALGIA